MNVRDVYDKLHRDPKDFPLFERIWDVLSKAPSSRHADDGEMVSLSADAFDYLQADGKWFTESVAGHTELFYDGTALRVMEHDGEQFQYEHTFNVH